MFRFTLYFLTKSYIMVSMKSKYIVHILLPDKRLKKYLEFAEELEEQGYYTWFTSFSKKFGVIVRGSIYGITHLHPPLKQRVGIFAFLKSKHIYAFKRERFSI